MPILIPRTHIVLLGAEQYYQKVIGVAPGNLVAYWPLWEASGAVAADASGNGRTGAYTGVTLGQIGIGDGNTCPSFDGVGDQVNVQSVSLATAFPSTAGSLLLWCKVTAAEWTDGNWRYSVDLRADASNFIYMFKAGGANTFSVGYQAGGVDKRINKAISVTTWMCYVITWSAVADQVKVYYNGIQEGATLGGLGVWAGALATSYIGVAATGERWVGTIAHAALWNTVLTGPQIADLAVV